MSEPTHLSDRGDDFTASVQQLWNTEEQQPCEPNDARHGEPAERES